MRIQLKTKHCNRPAELSWGEYRNPNAPWQEVALTMIDAETGERLLVATRSLSQFNMFALPGHLMLSISGANEGLFECLKDQGVVLAGGTLVPLGDELFVTARLTDRALAELVFAMSPPPPIGPLN